MSRIEATFEALRRKKEKGLVVYLTAGDPDARHSLSYLEAAAEGGADLIELGVPFSDPTADGPTIQAAAARALGGGMTVPGVLELAARFREKHDTPLVLFGYYNPFLRYGAARLCRDAAKAGADGFLVVDLPAEESGEMAPEARKAGLDWIALATPTTGEERLAAIAKGGSGFLYVVSVTGITGARTALPPGLSAWVRKVKGHVSLPVAVGFGISTPEMARAAAMHADAVVVGSAAVSIVAKHGKGPGGPRELSKFVAALKGALRASKGV
jgi:tryptophan synthase alpha chain